MWQRRIKMNTFPVTETVKELTCSTLINLPGSKSQPQLKKREGLHVDRWESAKLITFNISSVAFETFLFE